MFLSPVDLRSKFDQLGLAEFALENEYTCCLKDAYEVRLSTEPHPVVSIVVGFIDNGGNIRFIVHAFMRWDGTLAGSGLCDPKLLYDADWNCFKTR